MTPKDKHRAEVLWKNAKASKIARKEIAGMTPKHKAATARGRVQVSKDDLNSL